MAKKTVMKQRQSVNIHIGDKVHKRARKRARKRAPKREPKREPNVHTFTTPIINYPPNYVNPSVLQPLQQPQIASFIPNRATLPKRSVFPGSQTSSILTLDPSVPVPLVPTPLPPITPIPSSEQLNIGRDVARHFSTERPEFHSTAENALGGIDSNLGDAFEPIVRPETPRPRGRPARLLFIPEEEEQRRLERNARAREYRQRQRAEEQRAEEQAITEPISFIGEESQPPPAGLERERP